MSTPHNNANRNDIASIVLMPGDPLRAKYIAETYLENPVLFNNVRNMYGYTGTYKGKLISVMGSGMGMPSIGIYSYELFKFYNVETIIRIGSAGAYDESLDVFDVVLATSSWSESSYAKVQSGANEDIQYPNELLNHKIKQCASKLNIPIKECRIHSSDVFYHEENVDGYKQFKEKHHCLAVEMESFALFHNANVLGKKAACLLTISDSFVNKKVTTSKQREQSFHQMMELALETCRLENENETL